MDTIASKFSPNKTLAAERWSVEKKQRDWDAELRHFREQQRIRLTTIRVKSKRKVAELHERIFFTVRWANPKLPNSYQKIVFDYCDHLIGPLPDAPYPKWSLLVVWQDRLLSGPEAKVSVEIQNLMERLSRLVLKRDEALVKTLVNLEEKTQKIIISKEGDIAWHMEHMKNTRDEYWTIWYLSRRGLAPELSRFLKTYKDNIDARDPDFGYTALHYACKCNQFETLKILLAAGANEQVSIEADGRTPLHLAAAYGTREMVLELLAVGAVYEAKDNFGATALDLARQNKNTPVIMTLENWVSLVPAVEETPRPEEDLNSVSEEYLSTPFEVLMMMSPALRVVTSRLEGPVDSSSAFTKTESGMDVGAELRLCEKRAAMCEAEGFHSEAVKTKRRRWTVAKKAYEKQLENQAMERRNAESSTGNEHTIAGAGTQDKCFVALQHSSTNPAGQQRVNILDSTGESSDTQSLGSGSDISPPVIDTAPLIAPHPPGRKTPNGGSDSLAMGGGSAHLSVSFLHTICVDLAETFLADHLHEAAEIVMSDGLTLMGDKLELVPRIALLKRYSQLLLFLADKHDTMNNATNRQGAHSRPQRSKELTRQSSMLESKNRWKYGEVDRSVFGHEDVHGLDSLALDVSMTEEEASHFIALAAATSKTEDLILSDSVSEDRRNNGSVSNEVEDKDSQSLRRSVSFVPFPMTLPFQSSLTDSSILRDPNDHNDTTPPLPLHSLLAAPYKDSLFTTGGSNMEEHKLGPASMLELLREVAPAALPVTWRGPDPLTMSVYATLQPFQQYLVRTDNCLKEAIDLVKIQSRGQFLESVELGPLLHMAAESLDRQGRYEEALHFMAHAATVFERTLGQSDTETVSCLIELLRLTIRLNLVIANANKKERDRLRQIEIDQMNKYARAKLLESKPKGEGVHPTDKRNFKLVGYQATEVSRRLDRLTLVNPEAALRLSSKCYKLVALTDLIVAGEIDPTKVLIMDTTGKTEGSVSTGGGLQEDVWNRIRVNTSKDLPAAAVLHADALEISKYNESELML